MAKFRKVGGCRSVAALNHNNSSAATITLTTRLRTSIYRVCASMSKMCATSPHIIPGTRGVARVACSRVLRVTSLNTGILRDEYMRVTGGCNMRLLMYSDLGRGSKAVMERGAGVRGVLVDNITTSGGMTGVHITNLKGRPGDAFHLLGLLSGGGLGVSIVVRSLNGSNAGSMSFAITGSSVLHILSLLGRGGSCLNVGGLSSSRGITGISIVNTNVHSRSNITTGVFNTLTDVSIGARVIAASRVHVATLVSRTCTSLTMHGLRRAFFS